MVTTTKVGLILEINLSNGFYFRGECLEETEDKIVIIDRKNERLEISKSSIILCREVSSQ